MGVSQLFKDFANWSTVSGVPHIANSQTKLARLFWTIIFIIMLSVFIYQLYTMIAKFFSFPAGVNTDIYYSEQEFPVVTVCNSNPYKWTVVNDATNTQFTTMRNILKEYIDTVNGVTTPDTYGIQEQSAQIYDRDSRARDAIVLAAAELASGDLEPALYTYDNLISECTFGGKPCNRSDFTRFVDPVFGACYSFNEDPERGYTSNRAGMKFGLKLLVTVGQNTPDGQGDFLPTTHLAGARVAINTRGGAPSIEGSGISVGVGYQTAVSLTLTKAIRAKSPYGTCVDREDEETDYYPNKTYSLETCFSGCRQRTTLEKCNCANPRYNKLDSHGHCKPTKNDLDCLQSLKGDQANTANPNLDPIKSCGCNTPCDETTFLTTASLALYPAKMYYPATDSATGMAGSCTTDNMKFSNPRNVNCAEWYSYNGLLLQVFFESLKYELYTELPSYDLSAMLNDLGGQAGLWLGLSLISIVEVCGLMMLVFCFCFYGRRMKIRPSDIDPQKQQKAKEVEEFKKELDATDHKY